MKNQHHQYQITTMDRIGIVFLTWKRFLQHGLAQHRITLKQFFVLRQLNENQYLFPAQIAGMLFCDRPTASVIIKNIERKGWISREQDAKDGKRIKIRITEKGKDKLSSIPKKLYQEKQIPFDPFSCFTREEKAQFKKLMKKMVSHFKHIQKMK